MMFRRVADLAPGDAVRPFDDRLWHVASIEVPDERGAQVEVTFTHPTDGATEVVLWPDDLVRLA
jgi:hypothetical protein